MIKINLLVIFIFTMGLSNLSAQNLITSWTTYSLLNLAHSSLPQPSLVDETLTEIVQLNANKIVGDKMLWINETIKSVKVINSNETILGSPRMDRILVVSGIYQDYYSMDTFHYADLDVW